MHIYVVSRFTVSDKDIFDHFINYYLNLGVYKFIINFNYKLYEDEIKINNFIIDCINKYKDIIIYSNGPNGMDISEVKNIDQLKLLVLNNTSHDDFVIPADSDEFHEFDLPLNELVIKDIDYIKGSTNERITNDGTIKPIVDNINIFEQFPKINNKLFCHPKISLIRAKYFYMLGVGHHNIDIKYNLHCYNISSKTNHFRWNLQGQERMLNWIKLWESEKYKGWADINKYKKQLEIMETNNLLEYN